MLLRLLKMSILSSVNSILWNILLNIPLSWCWMSLLSLSYNIGLFSAVNIVTVCNSSHSARGLDAYVEISKYICIYSYVFFIDISIITVIHAIHVCLQTPLDVYQNMYPFPSSSVSTIKCFTYYGLESSNNYTRFIRY